MTLKGAHVRADLRRLRRRAANARARRKGTVAAAHAAQPGGDGVQAARRGG
ncbi:MAG: hypothetical protein MZW92_26000 [Comamonadaceae bacterium]|nr:hypothetical protein [Comamonadaceae bacterium]